jgi:hypothetical protein
MWIRRRSSWSWELLLWVPLMAVCARAGEPETTSRRDHGTTGSDQVDRPDDESPAAKARLPDGAAIPEGLVPLDPVAPVWIDKKRNRVVIVGEVCLREGMLEMFACTQGTKEHESVLAVPVRAFTVHVGLLAVGAEPGNPARWIPKFDPARGTPIEVTVFWTDEHGKRQRARAQDWVRQVKTRKAMDQMWVFGGSELHKDEQTGTPTYVADFGEFICISNFPGAMLDVPVESSDKAGDLLFETFTERIPPRGTKVTLVLTPKPENAKENREKKKTSEKDADE